MKMLNLNRHRIGMLISPSAYSSSSSYFVIRGGTCLSWDWPTDTFQRRSMHQRMAYLVNCHVSRKYSITAFLVRDFASKVSFFATASSFLLQSIVTFFGRPARVAWREAKFLSECLFPWPFAKWVDVGSLALRLTPNKGRRKYRVLQHDDHREISNETFNDSCATALSVMKDVT